MDISKLKIVWKYLTGGVGAVADYLLALLNACLSNLDPADKAKVQAVLNVADRVLATLTALKWLCPTKWQTAYAATMAAVLAVVTALEDLNIDKGELDAVRDAFAKAVESWSGPDDATCVDGSCIPKN